ncbi:MAG: hypothetical protein NT013_18880 [Planctomycetia bacterium]|nr:hypothetical protein [Planctomycetia bacterium]
MVLRWQHSYSEYLTAVPTFDALRLPLEGALADWLGEGLVRRDGGEPFARGLALGSLTVDQTQRLTLRTRSARVSWPRRWNDRRSPPLGSPIM